MDTVDLYRPVGVAELRLIEASEFRRFPPRLPEQPIFYPVCNETYAIEIAERWNARDAAGGFVTRFAVRSGLLAAYERHEIGMIFPTVKHLERIAPFRTVEELLAFATEKQIATVQPEYSGGELSLPDHLADAW